MGRPASSRAAIVNLPQVRASPRIKMRHLSRAAPFTPHLGTIALTHVRQCISRQIPCCSCCLTRASIDPATVSRCGVRLSSGRSCSGSIVVIKRRGWPSARLMECCDGRCSRYASAFSLSRISSLPAELYPFSCSGRSRERWFKYGLVGRAPTFSPMVSASYRFGGLAALLAPCVIASSGHGAFSYARSSCCMGRLFPSWSARCGSSRCDKPALSAHAPMAVALCCHAYIQCQAQRVPDRSMLLLSGR